MKHHILPLITLLCFTSLQAQSNKAKSLAQNLVSITTTFKDGHHGYGLGFITGERGNEVFIVTASHVIQDGQDIAITIRLKFKEEDNAFTAAIVKVPSNNDVALLKAPKPAGFKWLEQSPVLPRIEEKVTFVGIIDGKVYVPHSTGKVLTIANDLIHVGIDNVEQGFSGTPLINRCGIVGMLIGSSGNTAEAVSIGKIAELFGNDGAFSHTFTIGPPKKPCATLLKLGVLGGIGIRKNYSITLDNIPENLKEIGPHSDDIAFRPNDILDINVPEN